MYIFVFICLHILITVIEVRKITSGVDFCFRYRNSHRLEFCVVLFVPFGALEICCFQCHFTITSSLPHHKLIKGDMSCIFSILFKPYWTSLYLAPPFARVQVSAFQGEAQLIIMNGDVGYEPTTVVCCFLMFLSTLYQVRC